MMASFKFHFLLVLVLITFCSLMNCAKFDLCTNYHLTCPDLSTADFQEKSNQQILLQEIRRQLLKDSECIRVTLSANSLEDFVKHESDLWTRPKYWTHFEPEAELIGPVVSKRSLKIAYFGLDPFLDILRENSKEVYFGMDLTYATQDFKNNLEHLPMEKTFYEIGPVKDHNTGRVFFGIDVTIWDIIANKLELNIEYVPADSIPDVARKVSSGKADVSTVQLFHNYNWYHGTDLSPPMHVREVMLVASYPLARNRLLTIAEPFEPAVWAVTAASVVTICLALVVTAAITNWHKLESDPFLQVSIALGVMINEGISHDLITVTTTPCMQVILSTWIPSACLVGLAYQSNLLAALVKVGKEKPVDTFQDILDRGLTLHFSKGTATHYFLRTHPDPVARQALKEAGLEFDFVDGKSPGFVFEETLHGQAVFDSSNGRVIRVAHVLRPGKNLKLTSFHCGYFFGIGHPIKRRAFETIGTLTESGIFQSVKNRFTFFYQLPGREHYRREKVEPPWSSLTVTNVAPIFAVCGVMLVAGFGSFVAEYFMRKCGKSFQL